MKKDAPQVAAAPPVPQQMSPQQQLQRQLIMSQVLSEQRNQFANQCGHMQIEITLRDQRIVELEAMVRQKDARIVELEKTRVTPTVPAKKAKP